MSVAILEGRAKHTCANEIRKKTGTKKRASGSMLVQVANVTKGANMTEEEGK